MTLSTRHYSELDITLRMGDPVVKRPRNLPCKVVSLGRARKLWSSFEFRSALFITLLRFNPATRGTFLSWYNCNIDSGDKQTNSLDLEKAPTCLLTVHHAYSLSESNVLWSNKRLQWLIAWAIHAMEVRIQTNSARPWFSPWLPSHRSKSHRLVSRHGCPFDNVWDMRRTSVVVPFQIHFLITWRNNTFYCWPNNRNLTPSDDQY